MTAVRRKLSEQFLDSTFVQQESEQWETLIARLLQRLELPREAREDAKRTYEALGQQIANNLNAEYEDILIYPQGSMRTQTTISPRHPQNFDLDIMVELSSRAMHYADSDDMFERFGEALKGNEDVSGPPLEKARCWRLEYPGKPFYFDVTPAVPDTFGTTGASLKVRDPETIWSPTNPEDFARWFCERADLRFPFISRAFAQNRVVMDKAEVIPLPDQPVALDDVLRRTIQLIKLHRDSYYWYEPKRKAAQPISVILVTLATHAYEDLYKNKQNQFVSPIQLVLAIVDAMPDFIVPKHGKDYVDNPKLPSENFADKWHKDNGLRRAEFNRWHDALQTDLEALLFQSKKAATQEQIRKVFGEAGVEAWKASRPAEPLQSGLLSGILLGGFHEPTAPIKVGSRDTVG